MTRAARVVVPDYQLSLAIGKEGQNARLAAKLTGWRIDIRPDTAVTAPSAHSPQAEPRTTAAPPTGASAGASAGTGDAPDHE